MLIWIKCFLQQRIFIMMLSSLISTWWSPHWTTWRHGDMWIGNSWLTAEIIVFQCITCGLHCKFFSCCFVNLQSECIQSESSVRLWYHGYERTHWDHRPIPHWVLQQPCECVCLCMCIYRLCISLRMYCACLFFSTVVVFLRETHRRRRFRFAL